MTARRMRLGPFVSWTIVLATACSSRVVRIVAGTNDSVVVNNRLSVPLPVFGVDARGRRHTMTGLRYQHIGGDSISLTPDGRVTCSRRADAQVSVSHERLTKTFFLLCRPILAVSVKRIWVLADGGSADLDPTAIGMDGGHEPLIAGFAVVQDTSIAYIDHGKVFGRRPGETNIIIDAGDCSDWARVEVYKRVATSLSLAPFQVFVGGPVELAPGEFQTWRVTPGPYDIWTDDDTERGWIRVRHVEHQLLRRSTRGPVFMYCPREWNRYRAQHATKRICSRHRVREPQTGSRSRFLVRPRHTARRAASSERGQSTRPARLVLPSVT